MFELKRLASVAPSPIGHLILWLSCFALGAGLGWGGLGPWRGIDSLNDGELPAWVQAIGTLVAVAVAIAAPIWHADRRQSQRDQHTLWLITALAARVADGFDQLVAIAQMRSTVGGVERCDTGISEDLHAALCAIGITELPDDRLVHPIIALRETVRAGLDLSTAIKGQSFRGSALDLDDARKLCERADVEYGEIAEVYHERCGPFTRKPYTPLPPGLHNEAR